MSLSTMEVLSLEIGGQSVQLINKHGRKGIVKQKHAVQDFIKTFGTKFWLSATVAAAVIGMRPAQMLAAPAPQPPVTAGLQLWFEANTEGYVDGTQVLTWHDKSGFGRDLTASGTVDAPYFRATAANGRAAMDFDGVKSLMKTYGSSTFTVAEPTTFFVVYQCLDVDSSSTRGFVFDSMNSSIRQTFGRSGLGMMRMYANIDLNASGISFPFSSFEIWSGSFNQTVSTMYRNGTLVASGNSGGSSIQGFCVGALSTSGIWGYDYAHCQVAEILFYSGALSDSDRQAVGDWLNQKYSTFTINPPVNVSAPAISGPPQEGSTLIAGTGGWSGTPPFTYTYQWSHCDASGNNCSPIAGATGSNYVLTGTDVGTTLYVTVTTSNSAGVASASSAHTPVVTAFSANLPPVTAGLQLWYEAGTESSLDGSQIFTWHDKSGFAHDLTASSASDAPTFRASAVNGRAAIEFNGTSSLMKTYFSSFTLSEPTTFFIVFQDLDVNSSSSAGFIFDSMNSSIRQTFGHAGLSQWELYANIELGVAGVPTPFSNFEIWSGTFNQAASSIFRNSAQVASGQAGGSALNGFSVGALSTSGIWGYNYGHFKIAEILYYSTALNSVERQSVSDWLNTKYHSY